MVLGCVLVVGGCLVFGDLLTIAEALPTIDSGPPCGLGLGDHLSSTTRVLGTLEGLCSFVLGFGGLSQATLGSLRGLGSLGAAIEQE